MSRLAERFRTKHDEVISSRRAVPPQKVSYCSDAWGIGRCEKHLPDLQKNGIQRFKAKPRAWNYAYPMPEAKFDTDLGKLPLFFFGPGPGVAAAAEDDHRGWLMLIIYSASRKSHQTCFLGRVLCPSVGDTVAFNVVDLECLQTEVQVATLMRDAASSAGFTTLRLVYTQVPRVETCASVLS